MRYVARQETGLLHAGGSPPQQGTTDFEIIDFGTTDFVRPLFLINPKHWE